ncbi:MAG TPA: hypothetical protein VFS34_06520 [Thermoanaerobaculia bacterium]|nr:hypothetical protein [Thermoanaerobaculia bacterium]
MRRIACRRSRGQCLLLGFAVLAVVVLWVAADIRLRWTGFRRDAFWAAGIVFYAALLDVALGPTIDHRDRPPADLSLRALGPARRPGASPDE